jgi:hypothetical protein
MKYSLINPRIRCRAHRQIAISYSLCPQNDEAANMYGWLLFACTPINPERRQPWSSTGDKVRPSVSSGFSSRGQTFSYRMGVSADISSLGPWTFSSNMNSCCKLRMKKDSQLGLHVFSCGTFPLHVVISNPNMPEGDFDILRRCRSATFSQKIRGSGSSVVISTSSDKKK